MQKTAYEMRISDWSSDVCSSDLNAHIFAQVKLNAHGRANLDEFAAAIRSFPEVLEAYVLMGVFDFMLRIVAADIDAYERFFFTKLSKLPGVQEINSTVALSEVEATTALPIGCGVTEGAISAPESSFLPRSTRDVPRTSQRGHHSHPTRSAQPRPLH